jgi:hypothetical protein
MATTLSSIETSDGKHITSTVVVAGIAPLEIGTTVLGDIGQILSYSEKKHLHLHNECPA